MQLSQFLFDWGKKVSTERSWSIEAKSGWTLRSWWRLLTVQMNCTKFCDGASMDVSPSLIAWPNAAAALCTSWVSCESRESPITALLLTLRWPCCCTPLITALKMCPPVEWTLCGCCIHENEGEFSISLWTAGWMSRRGVVQWGPSQEPAWNTSRCCCFRSRSSCPCVFCWCCLAHWCR